MRNSGACLGHVGDIVHVIPDGRYIGRQETKHFLWLMMEDVPPEVLSDPRKRMYCIPLERLHFAYKLVGFKLDRALDLEDPYQPFLELATNEPSKGEYVLRYVRFGAYGLIYDKRGERYL